MNEQQQHATAGDLESYVIDALDLSARDRLEQHVATCDRCMSALCREAQIEMELPAVVRHAARSPDSSIWPRSRVRSVQYARVVPRAGLAALAAAAVVVLAFAASRSSGASRSQSMRTTESGTDSIQRGVSWECGDGADGQSCGASFSDAEPTRLSSLRVDSR